MNSRFIDERSITVLPGAPSVIDLGEFSLNENDDTIWVKMTSTSQGECPWPWSYGLFTWITENGRELGTVKVNGVCEGEVFRLGVGLAPEFRTGRLGFTPRNYNLKWIELGNPWYLTFSFKTGQEQAAGPELVGGSTLFVPFVEEIEEPNTQPDFSIEDAFAFLLFNWFLK